MFFVVVILSLVGTTLTSSLSKRGGGHNVLLINCPTCEHHNCDLSNLRQCEVCQIHTPHGNQPPADVNCLQAGHCHEDNYHHCCDNEGCVAHYFGQHASSAVTQPVSSVECPRCHSGGCDFNNRDQCSTCRIYLHGTLPHVHCLKENAFGHYYLTSNDTAATTESATSTTTVRTANTSSQTNPTSTGGHQTIQTNQLLHHIPCPASTHHIIDLTNTNLCEVCQIHFKNQLPHDTNCLTIDHQCKDDDNDLCCTDMACVENVFGNIPKSGASLNGNKIYCPECTTTHSCNFISCETCVYNDFIHGTQLHKFKTCELKGECSQNGVICCHDYPCIDKLFGTHFQTTPTIQSTSNPSITSKTTDRTTATTTTTKAHITTPDTTMPTIDSSVSSNGQPTHHVPSSTTLMYTTITNAPTTPSSSPNGTTKSCVDELKSCVMFKSMGVCHASPQERTKYDIAFQCRLTCDRCNETYEPLTTVALTIPTTVGATQGTNNSCVDELKNCAMFKSMGVCHASPQEGTKYDIAFQCKLTCDRCNETYKPLTTVASTIPSTIGTTLELYQPLTTVASTIANPTSTDGHIPCPVCTHNICDHSNTILCEVCQISFNHQPQPQNATCLNRGQCFEDDSNLCCTDLACVDIILKHLDAVTNYPLTQPEIHASIKREPEASNIGDLLREKGEKEN